MLGIKKITPKRNAIIIEYNKDGVPCVGMEVKDYEFEYPLVQACREILNVVPTLNLPKKEQK